MVLTVSVFAGPGTPSSKMWPFASSPSSSRSTRYFWPTTTCETCSRKSGIQRPSSWTSRVISCVDFMCVFQTDANWKCSIKLPLQQVGKTLASAPSFGARTQCQNDRQPRIRLGFANLGFKIARIRSTEQSRIVDKKHKLRSLEPGWTLISIFRTGRLRRVKKVQTFAFDHRRRIRREHGPHQSIQNASANSCLRGALDLADHSEKTLDVLAGLRGSDQHRRVIQKKDSLARFFDMFADCLSFPAFRFNQVPFVQDD